MAVVDNMAEDVEGGSKGHGDASDHGSICTNRSNAIGQGLHSKSITYVYT